MMQPARSAAERRGKSRVEFQFPGNVGGSARFLFAWGCLTNRPSIPPTNVVTISSFTTRGFTSFSENLINSQIALHDAWSFSLRPPNIPRNQRHRERKSAPNAINHESRLI